MKHAPSFLKTEWLFTGLLTLAASCIFLWSNTPFDIDDAPITYRYAENLAAGNGFVYNIGERVCGTSTPLYTLVLAVLRVGRVPIPLASNVINFFSSVGVVATMMLMVRELSPSRWAAPLAGVILLGQGTFVRWTMAGMETPVYALLIVASLLALSKGRTLWGASLAGLAALTRLDGFAVVTAVLLCCLIVRRRVPWREMLVVGVIVLPWVLFALAYFGSPIPLSMLAKQRHLQASHGSTFWIWNRLFVDIPRQHMLLQPFMALGIACCVRSRSELRRTLPPLAWLGLYLVAYTLVGIDFYEWYLVPVYPVLASIAAIGLVTTITLVLPQWPKYVRAIVAMLLVAVMTGPSLLTVYPNVAGFKQYLVRVEGTRVLAATWLRDHTPIQSRIMTGAIGHLGYESRRYIVDSSGLITPQVAGGVALVAMFQPDYLVIEGAVDGYEPIRHYQTGWADYPQLVIRQRVDATTARPSQEVRGPP